MNYKQIITMSATLSACMTMAAQVTFNFDMTQRGPKISDTHYGLFFEELSHAGDGGLYAELIQNRSFEDDENRPVCWTTSGSAIAQLTSENMMNASQHHALRLTAKAKGDGVRNEGYWGVNFVKNTTYKLSFWIRSDKGYVGNVRAMLIADNGTTSAATDMKVDAGAKWTKYEAELKARTSSANGRFALQLQQPGEVCLDMVSLFPPTYKDRDNGFRLDLATMLADIKSGFFRFPGGCYVEGTWDRNADNRYLWKNSVGPQEERLPLWNSKWGYMVTNGQGIYEYLQYSEDIGAKPIYVVNIGTGHEWDHPWNDMGEYIQEALDVIEYANGDENTYWGKKRIEAGHPESFRLEYIEVGNENYWCDHYAERYYEFYKAIKDKYPYVKVIGNTAALIENPVWGFGYPVDILDEHYYYEADWFIRAYDHYDNYNRYGPKIFVGEYSAYPFLNLGLKTWQYADLNCALGEAVFMEGMERNSDVVIMNCFSEPLGHVNDIHWHFMIYFNGEKSFGTPSYYIQRMFSNYTGKENIKWTESNNSFRITSSPSLGLATWSTSAEYYDIKVTDSKGNVVIDGSKTISTDWVNEAGEWTINDNKIVQNTVEGTRSTYILKNFDSPDTLIYTMKAKKISGVEGFIIPFQFNDIDNYAWWAIGGWGNTQHGIEQAINGSKTLITGIPGKIEANREYDIRIVKEGQHIQCYLDNELLHDCILQSAKKRNVYASANINDETGELFVKLVNPWDVSNDVHMAFSNGTVTSADGEILTSRSGRDENTLDEPTKISPENITLDVNPDGSIDYNMPAFSTVVLKLKVVNVPKFEPEVTWPKPLVKYSFETNGFSSDTIDGTSYPFTMTKGEIRTLNDGNHAFFSSNEGYINLGLKMPKEILPELRNDYSVSINVLLNDYLNFNAYCWAYGISSGTEDYISTVCTPYNSRWFYELRSNQRSSQFSNDVGLTVDKWHNLTYVQKNNKGTFFVDGEFIESLVPHIQPSFFANKINSAYIARSPFAADALMRNTYFDDFQIFDYALSKEELYTLCSHSKNLSTSEEKADAIDNISINTKVDVNYNVAGQKVDGSYNGIIIRNGKKMLIR